MSPPAQRRSMRLPTSGRTLAGYSSHQTLFIQHNTL
jgi:hypothetical protein